MNLSGRRASTGDEKLSPAKATLNPNAAEFVPFALRSQSTGITTAKASSKFTSSIASPGKSVFDRSESSISNNSEEEAQLYWRHQLPDDITPDFNFMGIDDNNTREIDNLYFSGLSLTDVNEGSRYTTSTSSSIMLKEQQGLSPRHLNGNNYAEKMRYRVTSYGEYPSPTRLGHSLAKPWDKQIISNDQFLAREGHPYNESSIHNFLGDMNEEFLGKNADEIPLEFLASQFPGFAAESLAEAYFANGGDLNLTIELLTQLELQVDGSLNQTIKSNALFTPNHSALDVPAFGLIDGLNGLPKFAGDNHQNISPHWISEKDSKTSVRSNSSIPSRGATDFASAVRKMASQDSSIWKYDGNGSPNTSIRSSRSPQSLGSSYNSHQGRGIYGDLLQSRDSAYASPVWPETGEAVANIYSDIREEARDHASVRNAFFEQARQAYLIGNKAQAKELSIKGQLHNMQMKSAHGKAQESIYHQRNPDMQANGRERMIDLHGLHVNEAIHVLKRELALLKNAAARSADRCLLAYISVGTGHHMRGLRTQARLPIAVQRYLLEEEGLDYTEPQPGLLRVVIY